MEDHISPHGSAADILLSDCPYDVVVLPDLPPPSCSNSAVVSANSSSLAQPENYFCAYQHVHSSTDSLDGDNRQGITASAPTYFVGGDIYARQRTWTGDRIHLPTPKRRKASSSSDSEVHSRLCGPNLFAGPVAVLRRKFKQFFETINPLNGFEGKDSLETYMWEQSLKVEPKEADKWDSVKPSRPPHVLKSPGIKPPKALSGASSSGPSNHYGGYRSSGRGLPSAFNTYSPGLLPELLEVQRSPLSNGSAVMHEKNSHLGMVEINPGQQPRYLGDARRGVVAQGSLTPSTPRPPPLAPRLRKEKASSTPPSPHTTNGGAQLPPPLYPRRTSPQFFATSPRLPPSPFHGVPAAASGGSGPTTPPSPPFSSAPTERMESFVFPPSTEAANRAFFTPETATTSAVPCSSTSALPPFVPAVPPRRKGDALPPPLPPEAVRVVWSGETSPKALAVSAVLPLPPTAEGAVPPILYPRCSHQQMQPPPRPPKKQSAKQDDALAEAAAAVDVQGMGAPSPPPLPPKTYKRHQRQS